jgi:hypothetical protein
VPGLRSPLTRRIGGWSVYSVSEAITDGNIAADPTLEETSAKRVRMLWSPKRLLLSSRPYAISSSPSEAFLPPESRHGKRVENAATSLVAENLPRASLPAESQLERYRLLTTLQDVVSSSTV